MRYAKGAKRKALNSALVSCGEKSEDVRLMKILLVLVLLVPFCAVAQEDRTSTVDGRVTMIGGAQRLRVAMVQDADVLIKDLDQVLGKVARKAVPIFVQLYPAVEGKPSGMRKQFFNVPEGEMRFRLQIDLWLGRGNSFDRKEFDRGLLEMLLMEKTLRALPEGETPEKVEIRPWLVEGLLEAVTWEKGRGDRRMYSSLMESGGWVEVEKLVDQTSLAEMNVLSRELFRASSGALVMALLSQTQGKKSMSAFLDQAAVFEGEQLTLLRTHFPQVNLGQKGLERWWMLQVAAMSEKKVTEPMTIPETDERLGKVLQLYLKDEKGRPMRVGLDSWRLVADLDEKEKRVEAVQPAADLLAHMSFRCFPTYRPVIGGYVAILSNLAEGKTGEVDEMRTNLETYRAAELKRFSQLVDLMDWYHLANVKEESGEFEDYLRVRENLRKSTGGRKDPISEYVDRVQKVFEKR